MKATSGLLVSGLALVLFAGAAPAWGAALPAVPSAAALVSAAASGPADSVARDALREPALRLTGPRHAVDGDATVLPVSDRETAPRYGRG